MQKTETRSTFFTLTNISSKWIKDLNLKPEALKHIQERAEKTLELIGNNFLNRTPMAQQLEKRLTNETT
jgi:hypothetical protein